MSQLQIFIADGSRDGRLPMQMLLEHEPGLKVVGIAVQMDGLVDQVTAVRPDVVLVDWQLLAKDPAELMQSLRHDAPERHIFVLDVRPESEDAALGYGADAFISKNAPPDELLSLIHKLRDSNG